MTFDVASACKLACLLDKKESKKIITFVEHSLTFQLQA